MRRAAAIALAALAAAPGAARAQFRARPMVIPAPASVPLGDQAAILTQPFATASGADLLVATDALPHALRAHHALLAPLASTYARPAAFGCAVAGRLAQNLGDALPDVAYCAGTAQLEVAFGSAPGALQPFAQALNAPYPTLSAVRLHPPALRSADVLVLPLNTGGASPTAGELVALDLDGGATGAPLSRASWTARAIARRSVLADEVLPIRLSATARALGVDDLYIPGSGSVTLLAHRSPPADATLAGVDLAPEVRVGGSPLVPGVDPAAWLPPGVEVGDVLGAAPLDVDLDGTIDLVLSMSPGFRYSADFPTGRLLWVRGTGNVADFATTAPWGDLTSHPDLQPLVDPAFLRGVELGGAPAAVLFDRGSDAVLVVTSDLPGGRLRVWRGSAAGRLVRDFRLADLVGSPAPDLVGDGTWRIAAVPAASPAVLVWPDLGDASPEIAWSPGSPGAATRGADLPLGVAARDADGTFTVEWLVGDPYGAPSASAAGLAGGAFAEFPWALDGSLLCGALPQTVAVTVRATDALGVFEEIATSQQVTLAPPALSLAAAVPPDRLPLPPGGAVATLEGSAAAGCGPVAFTWGGSVFAAAAGVVAEDGPTTTRRILDLPEASYAALLAGDPFATLLATEPGSGLESPPALLPLALDATGLVEVEHLSDVVALAPGEVTVLRTRLRSRLGVELRDVRVKDVLAGLAPAGAPRVAGAALVAVAAGGAEVVLDALPPAGAEVVVELPVRSVGARAGSAVEARSSGGHLLTPAASGGAPEGAGPGCACGGGGAGLEAVLALAALAARGRRRRAT